LATLVADGVINRVIDLFTEHFHIANLATYDPRPVPGSNDPNGDPEIGVVLADASRLLDDTDPT
jgi:hypothetical protein